MRAFHRRPIYHRFWLLMALEFLFGVAYGAFSLSLPILGESIFASVALLGVIFALPELFGMFVDIPIGEFANRFGRRRTIFFSSVLLACSALAFLVVKHPLLFVAALIFYELATQSFIVPGDAEQIALTPNRSAGRFNGIAEGIHNLGYSIGPLAVGFFLAYRLDYAFWFAFAVALIMMAVAFFFLPFESRRESAWRSADDVLEKDGMFVAGVREFYKLGFLGMFLTAIFFLFAFHWGFVALLEPLYTTALGLDDIHVGLIYAGFTIPIFFVGMLTGRLIDRRGVKAILVIGLFLMAFSSIGFGITTDQKTLFFLALISGVGDAFLLPAIMTLLDQLSSYRIKEEISGVKAFAESAGYFLGPLIGGVVAALVGFQNTFFSLGLLIFGFAIATMFVPIPTTAQR